MSLPEHFSGVVRLFPLPNLVVYPGIVQALHMFEPRYRQLTYDCLAADRLIANCLYRPIRQTATHPSHAESRPSIYQVVCISKIIADQQLADGRYNLLVGGVARARIVRELAAEVPYRMANVDVLNEFVAGEKSQLQTLQTELINLSKEHGILTNAQPGSDLEKILQGNVPLGLLTDLISFSSKLDCQERQHILEIPDVVLRCRTLLKLLRASKRAANRADPFPPDFSPN
jgi:Lon protease-like protein